MGLFNHILDAIDNPQAEANPSQLSGILNTVNTLGRNSKANPDSIQSAMSVVGKYTKNALRQQRQRRGQAGVENLISQYGGTNPNNQIVRTLFSAPQLQGLMREIEARTGMSHGTVRKILPFLVPLVLNLLKTGNRGNTMGSNIGAGMGSNSVLSGFLDTDGDGDVDVADALKLARRYM